MRPPFAVLTPRLVALSSVAVLLWACKENLPSGPDTITVAMSVTAWQDTLVVGRTKVATAKTMDGLNREVQGLHYTWSFADSTIARFTTDSATPGSSVVTALKPGATTATVSLPDARFVVAPITKNLRVVIAGLSVLSAHDTTLTAINDTARVIAGSLVQSGTGLVTRAGQGIKWIQRGAGTVSVIGTGDTIRVIARAAGVDTLIATHDFCLAGARCADTVYARVRQTLKLTLSPKSFVAWTFGDTAGPNIVLADRRGTGSALASIRLVPVTAADSAWVTITSVLGTTNASTGAMAAPKMVSAGNGTARVAIVGRNPDGTTADSDTLTFVIRQIAVRSSVEPLQSQLTEIDTIPVNVVARDIRGFAIADATLATSLSPGLTLDGRLLTVTTPTGLPFTGSITATVSGVALAASNPGAPATSVAVDTSLVTVVPAITYTADATSRVQNIALVLRAPGGAPLANRWVRFTANAGLVSADSVLSDAAGSIAVTWTPTTAAGRQILTGLVRPAANAVSTTDSAGLIVVRRTVTIMAGVPVASMSTRSIRTTTFVAGDTASIVVRVRDAVGNLVTTAVGSDVTFEITGGLVGATTCDAGVCSAIFTATTVPAGSINVRIAGLSVGTGLIGVAISAGAPYQLLFVTEPAQANPVTNTLLTTQPVLRVADAFGNTVATNAFTITATPTVAGGTTLTGTTATSVAGIVTFSGLTFGGTAGTITITFTGTDGTTVLAAALSGNVINP